MRSKRHRGRISPVSCSNLCVFLVFVGPRPRSFVVSLLFLRRNANLAGGFAGRLVPWFFVFFLFACFAFATYFDCTAGTTAFLSPCFSLFIRITGPSLRASSAKPGEKKSQNYVALEQAAWTTWNVVHYVDAKWLTTEGEKRGCAVRRFERI